MPGTHAEFIHAVNVVVSGVLAPDNIEGREWEDGTKVTHQEMREICALACYEIRLRMRRSNPAQRRAVRLLRRFLTPDQSRQMQQNRYFYHTSPSGAVYRLNPYMGWTRRVALHGKRYFETESYCLHDFPDDLGPSATDRERCMPPADLALAHLFLLTCDEEEFLAIANKKAIRSELWDGAYLRRMRAAKLERAHEQRTSADD